MARHAPPRSAHRSARPRDAALAVGFVALVGAAVGLALAPRAVPQDPMPLVVTQQPATSSVVATASLPVDRWTAVLAELDERRAVGYAESDPALLTEVYAAGSAPLQQDTAALTAITDAGARAVGVHLVVDRVSVVEELDDHAVLRVVDRMPAYRVVDRSGASAELRPGRGPRAWTIELTRSADGWRIATITAV